MALNQSFTPNIKEINSGVKFNYAPWWVIYCVMSTESVVD
jgi:hypothetical protein